jgi:predicted transcriptional regulator of viral defense system
VRLPATVALGRLRRLSKPVFSTGDAALYLGLKLPATTRLLQRLEKAGLALKIRDGLWTLDLAIDPLLLPEYLAAPFPAYVSLFTALQLHGLVSQVPSVVYAASLAPTRRIRTRVASYSIHRLAPTFYGGFRTLPSGVRLATPEKALADTLYLAPARSRLFAALPELEIPRGFDRAAARGWASRIPPGPRRAMFEQRLERLLRPRRSAVRR